MNRSTFFPVLLALFLLACKSKKKDPEAGTQFFPVLSFLQSQVRHVDTSLYAIVKISKAHGRVDTAYLRREDFRAAAQDFISLPDITTSALRTKYAETKMYDEDLKKVVLTYQPKNNSDFEQITRQEVLIEPGDEKGDKVQTIYLETLLNAGDSTVRKRMTWNVTGNFQVIKLVSKTGRPEDVQTTDVTWSN